MNLSWLDDFVALAATGNFSRAAAERHLTQPAFSRRIKALEEWLGVELFDRSTQPVRLTHAGQWFRKVSQELLAQVVRVPGDARAIAEAGSTTLRIAATHALSFTFLPAWLRSLESRVSIGPVQLVSDVQPRCEALLLQSQVHFVLGYAHPRVQSPLQKQDYPSVLVGADRLLPVTAVNAQGEPKHRLREGKTSAPIPTLDYTAESGLGNILREVHGRDLERRPLKSVFTAHLASVLRTMALDGRGLAWLPERLICDDLASGRLLVAASDKWQVDLEIRLHRDHAGLGKAAEAFWEAACAAVSKPRDQERAYAGATLL